MNSITTKYNTFRNRIFIVFLLVMIIVLTFVAVSTYYSVANLLKTNAEKQIQETAVQASGKMDTLYQQINMLTTQVATNSSVQQMLFNLKQGEAITFAQRQSLLNIGNSFQAYSDGILSFELYAANGQRLFPLSDVPTGREIQARWFERAEQEKGRQVWIGKSENSNNQLLAIKRISLINLNYTGGGYLLVRMDPDHFRLAEDSSSALKDGYAILLDNQDQPISTNYPGNTGYLLNTRSKTIQIEGKAYMINKHQSAETGWTVVLATPVSELTSGITVLRTVILLSGALGLLVFFASSFVFSTMITRPLHRLTKTMRKAREGELVTNTDYSTIIEIRELNQTYNQLVENTNHLISMVYEKELIRNRSELKALQAQINPHFLFNTLNALYWLLDEKGEETLAEHVIAMSELFRYTISSRSKDEWVRVEDEISHAERYMHIMQMRFGQRLAWTIHVDPSCEKVPIPKLMIQPFIENAIVHGIETKAEGGTITVLVKDDPLNESVRIEVRDNGIGIKKEQLKKIQDSFEKEGGFSSEGNGMAIVNVNKRLQLYYPDEKWNQVQIESEWGKGTKVTLHIPKKELVYNERKKHLSG